ncbi:MAG TPA: hypothetical protein VL132_14995 [Planctomycetaceae bacterium]|nr:hypothetical protein [Planctomycetaceae bacterium]
MSTFPVLRFSDRITCLPIIHGSGDCAVEVRRFLLTNSCDCLAVPLPPSFQTGVERAIEFLPTISLVVQPEPQVFAAQEWTPESDVTGADDEDDDDIPSASYVPIDPCQGVVAALRMAMQERIPRAFIDRETARFEVLTAHLPDPYALKQVRPDRFAAALLPSIPRLPAGQPQDRAVTMAARLRELEERYGSIVFVCSIMDWPWIRDAYMDRAQPSVAEEDVEETAIYAADPKTLLFLLGELPYITGLYERARNELDDDENLSVDGVKAMLLAARDRYQDDLGQRARKISPKLLRTYFQYVRNLSLIDRQFTPDLYTLITAARQIAGDQFAIHLAETAGEYPFVGAIPYPTVQLGKRRARFPDESLAELKCRLPGRAISWRTCRLQPKPPKPSQEEWQMRWNPFHQCSWPLEDLAIEKFRTHVKDVALALLGTDLARSEKFSASMKDGLDIRETLRNWHTGDLYVKVLPPSRGALDCVVMLFDSPADPREYPWRVTWHAEHHDESTLALFATEYRGNMVGPGIGQATYGGALFLFPPRAVPDIWHDPRFDYVDTLEERLLAAACQHARERHIAILSAAPPGPAWRQIARRYGKKLLHVPLGKFSQETVQQLRMFHVLNGTKVRSYAAEFIRKA